MQLSKNRLKSLWPHGKSVMPLSLVLIACLVTLSGCASKQPTLAVDCPRSVQIPATLKESSLPEVQSLSNEAQSYFKDVSDFLRELQSTKTP